MSRGGLETSDAEGFDAIDVDCGAIVDQHNDGACTADIFTRLSELSDADVMDLVAMVMAETLAAGTSLIDTLVGIFQ